MGLSFPKQSQTAARRPSHYRVVLEFLGCDGLLAGPVEARYFQRYQEAHEYAASMVGTVVGDRKVYRATVQQWVGDASVH